MWGAIILLKWTWNRRNNQISSLPHHREPTALRDYVQQMLSQEWLNIHLPTSNVGTSVASAVFLCQSRAVLFESRSALRLKLQGASNVISQSSQCFTIPSCRLTQSVGLCRTTVSQSQDMGGHPNLALRTNITTES